MQFGVCPHDTSRNLIAWIDLSTYLSKQIKQHLALDNCLDFQRFYQRVFDQVEIAYVNPMDALRLGEDRDFIPICGTTLYDETIFVTSREITNASLTHFANQDICCVDHQFATYLGLYELKQLELKPNKLEFKASWLKVISDLSKGHFHFGMLYSDFYHQLTQLSKKHFKTIHITDYKTVTHIFMLHPQHADQYTTVLNALLHMHENETGRKLMDALRIDNWRPVNDLDAIKNIVETAKAFL